MVHHDKQHCDEDLQYFESKDCPGGETDLRVRLRNVLDNDFVRITYTQVQMRPTMLSINLDEIFVSSPFQSCV